MRSPTQSKAPQGLPREPLGEVLDFLRLIWALDQSLQRVSKHMERSLGVTGPQRLTMRIVGRFPGILAGQLAETLHLHPSTVTGILKRLELRGLLTRRRDPLDGRRAMLDLTAKGRRLEQTAAAGTVEAAVRSALSELSAPAVRHTVASLRLLAARLDPRAQPHPPDRRPPRRPRRHG